MDNPLGIETWAWVGLCVMASVTLFGLLLVFTGIIGPKR